MADAPPARPPRPAPRLERQLLGQLLLMLGGLWLLGSLLAAWELREEINEVLDSALRETAQRLLALPDSRAAPLPPSEPPDPGHDYVAYQLFAHDGRLLMRSHHAPDEPLVPLGRDGLSNEPTGRWRVVQHADPARTRHALVAEPIWHRRTTVWGAISTLLVPLLVMLPLAALGLHLTLRRAFRRLEPVQNDLARRPAHDLQPVRLDGAPHELQPLLATVNALMARVQHLLDAERTFSASVAHELRTPLAAARAQAQRLAAEAGAADPDKVRDRALALMRQLDRLTQLATRLLQLARIDAGVALQREPLDLRQLARLIVEEFPQARQPGRLVVEAEAVDDAGATVAGDLDALGMALRNLVDNALKHGGDGARVVVRVRPAEISVIDDGPGAPQADLATLLQPFQRGITPVGGSGLGLAMVQAIARQSGATLDLRSPVAHGHGWQASLRFATADAAAPVSPA